MSVRPPSVSSSEGVSPTDPNAPVMMPMSAAKKAANAASSSSASSTATASQQPGSAMRAQHSLLAESPLCRGEDGKWTVGALKENVVVDFASGVMRTASGTVVEPSTPAEEHLDG